jgi:hypothetical protein
MSGENQQDPNVNTDGSKNQEQETDLERLKATNKRLLEESMSYKDKYKKALAEKEELESKKLNESGSLSDQLAHEKRLRQQAEEKLGQTTKKVVSQAVKEKILKYAGDVYSLEDLMSKPKLKEYLKQGLDEENLDFNDESAKAFVDDIKKESPYLWRSSQPVAALTSKPGGINASSSNVDTAKMTPQELKEYLLTKFK